MYMTELEVHSKQSSLEVRITSHSHYLIFKMDRYEPLHLAEENDEEINGKTSEMENPSLRSMKRSNKMASLCFCEGD